MGRLGGAMGRLSGDEAGAGTPSALAASATGGNLTLTGALTAAVVAVPAVAQTITSSGGVASSRIDPTSSSNLLLTPTEGTAYTAASPLPFIVAGTRDGQMLRLKNDHALFTITLNAVASNGLRLDNNSSKVLAPKDTIEFRWNSAGPHWEQVSAVMVLP